MHGWKRIPYGLYLAFLATLCLISCQGRVYLFQLYPYPETADVYGSDWDTLAAVTESSFKAEGFREPGERVVNVQISSSDGTILVDRSIRFLGENALKLDGKWVSDAEFLLTITDDLSEGTGTVSQMTSVFHFHAEVAN